MKNKLRHYSLLSELFRYPETGFVNRASAAQLFLDVHYPAAAALLGPFTSWVSRVTPIELEELFTRSFDVQAVTTLDLGYVLFGDDYKRGALLVNLNREHRDADNPCHNELADHLPNVLCLLPQMDDAQLRAELVEKIVAPALAKIISDFEPKKLDAKKNVYLKHHGTWIDRSEDYGTIYQRPLAALASVLEEDFHPKRTTAPRPSADFLKNIGTEIELEAE